MRLIAIILLSFVYCQEEIIIYENNFENDVGLEWNYSYVMDYNGSYILGNYANVDLTLILDEIPLYNNITVEFDLYILDSMDGSEWGNSQDYISFLLNGSTLLYTSFSNNPSGPQCYPDNCPASNPYYTGAVTSGLPSPYYDGFYSSLYRIELSTTEFSENLNFTIHPDLDECYDGEWFCTNESWGIDNLIIKTTVVSGCTDESAYNFDADVTLDDGSCVYPDNGDYSLNFDGVDDFVEYGGNNLPIGNSDRTISCWVRPLVVDQYSLFGYGNQDENTAFEIFFYDDNGTLRPAVHYAFGNSGYENGLEVNLNEWNHLVATYDGISSRIYVNGAISITDIQPLNTEKVYRHIGAPNYTAPTTPGYFLDGIIKGCAIWNNTLTDNEINSLYNNGNHIDLSSNYEDYLSSDNLVAHFKFNTGTGEILYDHSGNGNHGEIHGAQWVENNQLGDMNDDYELNVIDIVALVNIIIDYNTSGINPTEQQLESGDINQDGILNVIDIVGLVNIILSD